MLLFSSVWNILVCTHILRYCMVVSGWSSTLELHISHAFVVSVGSSTICTHICSSCFGRLWTQLDHNSYIHIIIYPSLFCIGDCAIGHCADVWSVQLSVDTLYPPGVHVTGEHVLSEQISDRGNFMLIFIHRNIMWGSFMVLTLTVVRLVIVHVCGPCSCLSIQIRQTCMITVNTYICQACVITVRTLDSGGLVIEGLSFRDRMRA